MNRRPLAHGNGIVTRPKKPSIDMRARRIAERVAEAVITPCMVCGGIVAFMISMAAYLVMLLLFLSPFILCLAAAAWIIYQVLP